MQKIPSIYCESFDNFLTNQPFNTLTNIAFIIAGILLIKLYREKGIKSNSIITLITLVFLVGIGSTIWHFSETFVGKMLDVIPISLLIFAYLVLFLKKVAGKSTLFAVITLIIFIGINFFALQIFEKEPLKSSAGYFPAFLMLALMTFHTFRKKLMIAKEMLLALLIFMFAIVFRSTDYLVCDAFSVGTHFIWHILVGFLVYFIVRALIKHEALTT